jgi:hypothetical protein
MVGGEQGRSMNVACSKPHAGSDGSLGENSITAVTHPNIVFILTDDLNGEAASPGSLREQAARDLRDLDLIGAAVDLQHLRVAT